MIKKILNYLFISFKIILPYLIPLILILLLACLVSTGSIEIYQALTSLGAIIIGFFYYQRNSIFEKQLTQKDEQYIKDSQFRNFFEATKMLTDKESTIEAKISALFLLYDVAKAHPENIDRIIQVINKQLTPLLNCIENNCNTKLYTKQLVSSEKKSYPNRRKDTFEYLKNDTVVFSVNDRNTSKIIKEWQYKGNDTEKLISVSLYVLRKIVLNILPNIDEHIELSNSIIFDIDTDFDKNLKFKSKKRPTENLIFLNCKLHKVNFEKTIYHYATFINCDLTDSDFTDANLWGALFDKCNLKGVNFKDTECEGVEFKNCEKLTKNQIETMKFKNKTDTKKYLIILSGEYSLGLDKNSYFPSRENFITWRYPDDQN